MDSWLGLETTPSLLAQMVRAHNWVARWRPECWQHDSGVLESNRTWQGRLMLHQKGLDPVMVLPLADPISDRVDFRRHLEPLAEGLGEPLQGWPGKSPDRVAQLTDGGRIEGRKAWIWRRR